MPSSIDILREREVERYFKQQVKDTGGHTRKVRWLCQNGAPDRIAWWDFPRVAFVELKATKEKPKPGSAQEREIKLLRKTGWPVYVIDSREAVDAFIDEMSQI